MSTTTATGVSSRMALAGSRIATWIRGGKPAPAERWPAWYVLNLVSGTAIVVILLINLFSLVIGVGVTPDPKCIPGDLFVFARKAPDEIRFERGETYLFRWQAQVGPGVGAPIVKKLAAMPGDHVRVAADGVWINDVLWGPVSEAVFTKMGMSAEKVFREFTVGEDEYLMLGTLPATFDGRYTGPVTKKAFYGHVLWVYGE